MMDAHMGGHSNDKSEQANEVHSPQPTSMNEGANLNASFYYLSFQFDSGRYIGFLLMMDAHVGGHSNDKCERANEVHSPQPTSMNEGARAYVGGLPMDDLHDSDMETISSKDFNSGDVENRSGSLTLDVLSKLKPRVGMEFAMLEDAFNFYNSYAWHCGFSVRKDSTRKLKSGAISRRVLRCSKAGTVVHSDDQKHKILTTTRCSCPAKLSVNLKVQQNVYHITQFVEAHNHALCTPSKTTRLRSHKLVTEEELNMIRSLKASEIVARSFDFMRTEVGGPSHPSSSERNAGNALKRKRQATYGTDANTLLHFFQMKSQEDSQFTYEIQVDEDMRLTSCFWVDGKSKEDYLAFSDVVCFDTTYKTHEYDMPFGPFIGVNHHMQTVLFGAGLLFGEMVDDFKWLFQTWLNAMGGVHPKTIITDEDETIRAAIAAVFPNANHILCLWHITKKLPEKLSHTVHEHPTFKAAWNNCLYNIKNIEDCESNWSAMIKEFDLHNNSWLQHMFEIRHLWIPTFIRKIFLAGMRFNGRNESINAFFDGFVNPKYNLMDFANGYEKALEKRRKDETIADFETSHGKPVLKTKWGIEAEMADVYTLKVFLEFQKEVEESTYYIAEKISSEGAMQQWQVYKFEQLDKSKHKSISWNVDDKMASCSCMKFESCGIICRHIIALFRFMRIISMPHSHVLARWTQIANTQFKHPCNSNSRNATQSFMIRNHALSKSWCFLRHEALTNPDAYDIVREYMGKATTAVLALPKKDSIGNTCHDQAEREGHPTGQHK